MDLETLRMEMMEPLTRNTHRTGPPEMEPGGTNLLSLVKICGAQTWIWIWIIPRWLSPFYRTRC